MHFYGEKDYRNQLRIAVKGFLVILVQAEDEDAFRDIFETLRIALTEQLDWSLDDLELDAEEKRAVGVILSAPHSSSWNRETYIAKYKAQYQ